MNATATTTFIPTDFIEKVRCECPVHPRSYLAKDRHAAHIQAQQELIKHLDSNLPHGLSMSVNNTRSGININVVDNAALTENTGEYLKDLTDELMLAGMGNLESQITAYRPYSSEGSPGGAYFEFYREEVGFGYSNDARGQVYHEFGNFSDMWTKFINLV